MVTQTQERSLKRAEAQRRCLGAPCLWTPLQNDKLPSCLSQEGGEVSFRDNTWKLTQKPTLTLRQAPGNDFGMHWGGGGARNPGITASQEYWYHKETQALSPSSGTAGTSTWSSWPGVLKLPLHTRWMVRERPLFTQRKMLEGSSLGGGVKI